MTTRGGGMKFLEDSGDEWKLPGEPYAALLQNKLILNRIIWIFLWYSVNLVAQSQEFSVGVKFPA